MNKKILIASIAAVAALTMFGIGTINAQSTATAGTSIVDRVAQKFGLNRDEVQKVFDEHRDEMHKAQQEKMQAKLDQLVADGKLTEDQKNKLLAKLAERQNSKPDFENLTREQIKEKMETERTDFENWAEGNGIDLDAIGFKMGMKPGMGMHKWEGKVD